MIPVYCMQEHHEAFYYWGLAIEKKYINEKGNTLFHIDHHDDFECGGYKRDFTKSFSSLEERKKFTYEELGIADFIVPAMYEGIFSQFYNMKSVVPKKFVHQDRFIRRIGNNALTVGEYIPFLHSQYRKDNNNEYSFFTYFEGSLESTEQLENVVLDIDLDYFCWDDTLSTVPPKRLEITEEAYKEYINNPYHAFRILPRKLIRAEAVDGRFYLRYEEPIVFEKQADEEKIHKRVDRFEKWLSSLSWKPSLITVCRSANSGYLPSQYAKLVEVLVKNCLQNIYELDYKN